MKNTTYKFIEIETVDSTNNFAMKKIDTMPNPHGIVISAKEQTNARGTKQHKWIAPRGNLYLSIIYSMNVINDPFYMQYIAALATAKTIIQYIKNGVVTYKYPNDVLVDRKKISGVLVEVFKGYMIVGIGINIQTAPLCISTCINNYSSEPCKEKVTNSLMHDLNLTIDEYNRYGTEMISWNCEKYGGFSKIDMIKANDLIS